MHPTSQLGTQRVAQIASHTALIWLSVGLRLISLGAGWVPLRTRLVCHGTWLGHGWA